ncbi:MAG: hypothetical protein WBP59_03710, partial [Ilumatobacteraceae bacterium]
GYTDIVERGSYSHVKQATVYESYYRVKSSRNAPYVPVDEATYDSARSNRRDSGWEVVTKAEHDGIVNTRPWDSGNSLGRRTNTVDTPVSTTEYNANSSNPAYRAVSKTWSDGPDWEIWTGSQSGSSSHYRTNRVYNQPPYTGYASATTHQLQNSKILANLIAANDYGTPATWDGSSYTNADIADMYVLPQWSQFDEAMSAVALGDCGGTLTLQTKVNGSTSARDPFRYQTSAITDSAGDAVPFEPSFVVTNQQFVTGTFDFPVPNGQYVTVDIVPQNYTELTRYTPGSWTCRAGNENRPFELVDIPDAGAWKGVRVRIAANEAVSCQLSVTQ